MFAFVLKLSDYSYICITFPNIINRHIQNEEQILHTDYSLIAV